MRPTPTTVAQSLYARIQVKTYPYNSILRGSQATEFCCYRKKKRDQEGLTEGEIYGNIVRHLLALRGPFLDLQLIVLIIKTHPNYNGLHCDI